MSLVVDIVSGILIAAGILFFAAGVLGLVRFPDTLTRIHALAKADNLGLALIVLGLLPQAPGFLAGVKMVAVWLMAQLVSGAISQVVAAHVIDEARDAGSAPGEQP